MWKTQPPKFDGELKENFGISQTNRRVIKKF